jgi:hypothetical protein
MDSAPMQKSGFSPRPTIGHESQALTVAAKKPLCEYIAEQILARLSQGSGPVQPGVSATAQAPRTRGSGMQASQPWAGNIMARHPQSLGQASRGRPERG